MAKLISILAPADLAGIDPAIAGEGGRVVLDAPSGKRLLDHATVAEIAGFIAEAHARGLKAGLAGALEGPDIARLVSLKPDFFIVDAVMLPEAAALARPRAAASAQAEVKTDRIIVRDFVLPVAIGAYSFEHGRTQRVRFDVTAHVARPDHGAQDMRDVFSYDVILDGIRTIVAQGHVVLSEALAEAVAAHVRADARVLKVIVRVEKLELGAGGVGVEIERP